MMGFNFKYCLSNIIAAGWHDFKTEPILVGSMNQMVRWLLCRYTYVGKNESSSCNLRTAIYYQ